MALKKREFTPESGTVDTYAVILFEHVTGHLGNSVENVASG